MILRKEILSCVGTEKCDTCKRKCHKVKTNENWKGSLSDYLQVGDLVDEKIVQYVYNCLPPRTMTNIMVQMGEPYSHKEDEIGKWRSTYSTFVKTEQGWVYAGNCFKGQYKNID